MNKRAVALASMVGVLVPVLVMTSAPAWAADSVGVSVNALNSCHTLTPWGGWDDRDVVGNGTRGNADTVPVRPRNIRLLEPCLDDMDGAVDELVTLPYILNDVQRDGSADLEPGSDGFFPAVSVHASCPELKTHGKFVYAGSSSLCSGGDPYGAWVLDLEFSGGGASVSVDYERIHGSGAQGGIALHWYCYVPPGDPTQVGSYVRNYTRMTEDDGKISTGWGSGSGSIQTLGVVATRDFTCSTGVLARVFIGGATTPVSPWEQLRGWWSTVVPDGPFEGGGTGWFEGTQAAQFIIGAGALHSLDGTNSRVVCQQELGSGVVETYEFARTLDSFGLSPEPPVLDEFGEVVPNGWGVRVFDHMGTAYPFFDAEDCGNLVEVVLHICAYVGYGGDELNCTIHQWSAERWRDRDLYSPDDPDVVICQQFPSLPECQQVLYPPYVDPTDFDAVCADGPEPTWAVWDWLTPWIQHYAGCLLIPQGGLDRHGKFESAFKSSPAGALAQAGADVIESFHFEGDCGILIDTDVFGMDIVMDTCTWGWATPIRAALYWVVLLFGGWNVLAFTFATTMSIFKAAKMPALIEKVDES